MPDTGAYFTENGKVNKFSAKKKMVVGRTMSDAAFTLSTAPIWSTGPPYERAYVQDRHCALTSFRDLGSNGR